MYDENSEETIQRKDLAEQESTERPVRVHETHREMCESTVVEGLGDLTSKKSPSVFCCGGKIEAKNIRLHRQLRETTMDLILPGSDEELVLQFFRSECFETVKCEAGMKDQDTSAFTCVRNLNANKFFTSFQLCDTAILGDIKSLIAHDHMIEAELNELHLTSPTDSQAKWHEEEACSQIEAPNIAKLVVCLPTQFIGGALIMKYKGQEVTFDWSSTPQVPLKTLCWAAFFSNVELETLPVTSRHRLMLTYNIYSVTKRPLEIFSMNPFYISLQEALKSPQFLREGGCLGFRCQHAYALNELNSERKLSCNLKGADYEIYHTAKLLGLKAAVRPIVEGQKHFYLLPDFSQKFGMCDDPDLWYYHDQEENKHHITTLAVLESMFKGDEDDDEDDEGSATNNKSIIPPSTACSDIVLCGSTFNPSWRDVIGEISDPIHHQETKLSRVCQSVPNMLKYPQQSVDRVLESAGLSRYDRAIISRALENVKDVRQPAGAYTFYDAQPLLPGPSLRDTIREKNALLVAMLCDIPEPAHVGICYQSAVIQVNIPCWGDILRPAPTSGCDEHPPPPKRPQLEERECITDAKNILFWKK